MKSSPGTHHIKHSLPALISEFNGMSEKITERGEVASNSFIIILACVVMHFFKISLEFVKCNDHCIATCI